MRLWEKRVVSPWEKARGIISGSKFQAEQVRREKERNGS